MTKDLRKHRRQSAEVPIAVSAKGTQVKAQIQFSTQDISEGGAFIQSDLLFEVGEELQLTFMLPGGRRIKVASVVARIDRGGHPGMGIRFIKLSPEDQAAIARLVASLATQP